MDFTAHFTYSKVMAWVAFDRAIKSAEMHDLPGPVAGKGQQQQAVPSTAG